ncbi:MAG: valine--tRNA ligase [Candidatus Thermoplasmatota archaeon]|nr:valine--tRNA ligase [Euryarchaeota archaeon]MBU4032784.1 valine--tRNA ligase [Candidatus Thermoplasmatota archaeon]MBU4071948.1 valine--tRNA ligase [Candidatus Thermoplasmatota archaeon]MBU4143586.1 valine--tRNA ligase [Candidatus Thermoplasmatota archaeon]MBU4591361.1 valine--tRNA ligase [Candidatus Thermoplasmatota archaeon]
MDEYDAKAVESKWQELWDQWELYNFDKESEKPVYSIDNPPRYASGPLHVGHATHYTHIDFAARFRWQTGHNVLFPLCVDVNGMPIEVNVEKKYNIRMRDTPRQEFIALCKEFADANIDRINQQFKMLGCCMDSSQFYRTDAEYYRRLTQITFIRLYNEELIYKGLAPVNWCPRCGTALADAEVEYENRESTLNYIRFGVAGMDEDALVATTRPELICTCQMAAVSPKDEKLAHLIGKKLVTPIYGKEVEIIADDKVDPEFGTGLVMICSIGDKVDLEWIYKYKLPIENAMDGQGIMSHTAGKYKGLSIAEARAAIIEDLKNDDLLVRQEKAPQSVGSCWRCHTPIEFLQMPQWFLKTLDAREDVLEIADQLNWYPEFMKVRLQNWVNSLNRDWVISRQRYFATPIPIWECNACGEIVLAKEEDCYVDPTVDEPPVPECPECGEQLTGCEDVFDTWMDSSISPLYITFWERDSALHETLWPANLRPQGQDIIRTWAFYTILRSHYLVGTKPWDDIMVDGFILAPDGRPMHASDGNVIDPLDLLEKYGTDAWRYYSSTVTIGEDAAIQEKDILHGQRFCAKVWNIHRFLSKAIRAPEAVPASELRPSDRWLLTQYSRLVSEVTVDYEEFHFDRAMRALEQFIWHVFADHYVEMVKYRMSGEDKALAYTLHEVGLGTLKMLAPIMPHICDEIYEQIYRKHDGAKSITVSDWPEPVHDDADDFDRGELLKDVIAAIRSWKSENGMALSAELSVVEIIGRNAEFLMGSEPDITGTLKVKDVLLMAESDVTEKVVEIKPVHAIFGPRFKQDAKEIAGKLAAVDPEDVARALESGELDVQLGNGEIVKIERDMVNIIKSPMIDGKEVKSVNVGELLILIGKGE